MIAIPDMDKPKNCAECFRILNCKAVPRWVTADDSIPKSCPLIDIVTCGECKWSYTAERDGTLWCKVHMSHYRVIADHFCKYGERIDESDKQEEWLDFREEQEFNDRWGTE